MTILVLKSNTRNLKELIINIHIIRFMFTLKVIYM